MATQSDIERVVDEGRIAIARRDDAALRQIHRLYEDLIGRLEFEIRRLDSQIAMAWRQGDYDAVIAWTRRQEWFRSLNELAQAEVDRFVNRTQLVSIGAQVDAVSLAASTTGTVIEMIPSASPLNPSALERWIIAARSPQSPVAEVLAKFGDIGNVIEKAITDGMSMGRGSSNITRTIMMQVEDAIPEYRVAGVVRTETMRAYRSSQADSFAVLDEQRVLDGYIWMSAKDSTTCALCLAMDGQIFPTYPGRQHVRCRCVAAPYVLESIVPRLGAPRENGEQWLLRQTESVQRRALGTPGRYDLWKSGTPLRSMVSVEVHPRWGETVRFTPLKELRSAS